MRVRLENGVVINIDDIKEVKIGERGKNYLGGQRMSNKLKKALAVAAILLFGAVNLSNFNQQRDEIIHVENYKVRAGDTFWNISERFYQLDDRNIYILEYQDELRALNPHLKDNQFQLQPNDFITVRYVKKK